MNELKNQFFQQKNYIGNINRSGRELRTQFGNTYFNNIFNVQKNKLLKNSQNYIDYI